MNISTRFCCLLLGSLVASGCQPRNNFVPPPPPKVTVATPILRPVQEYFETTGQTRAVQEVNLLARVGGYLEEIRFKDGEMVQAGDVLFVIDQNTYQAAVESAKASLKRAEALLRLAEQQLVRTKTLAKENAATESSLDIQNAERDSKEADVDAAKAALREAELNLGYTVITAPFAGRMGRHLVDIGNLVIAGQTPLASLESVDPMHAYFTLSEADLLRFTEMQKSGQLKPITAADPIKLDLALGDTQNFQFHGHLDFRKFGINPETGTAERRAVFPNNPPELMPGLFVRLRAELGEPHPYLLVDEQAVGRDQGGDFLLIVNSDNKVEARKVKLGPRDKGLQAIASGIEASDRVVIQGLQRARPGSTVDPTLVPMDSRLSQQKAPASAESVPATPSQGEGAPQVETPVNPGEEKSEAPAP
ncbi:efflux RND transporter periplasmic adaptor subunit [Planctomicrobium sp. SH661]|uniref:efflux RND transporter periplasmic adaptor subunit n=1 Tax=Planctomicrobium sp. SH661 TaxID=3448124 RepID=UPI003F5B1CBF